MPALHKDLYLEQGADWPGEAFAMVDALDNPKTLGPPMVGSGAIAGPNGEPMFTWSTQPGAGQGLIVLQGPLFIPQVTKAQNELWTFTNAPYQLYLYDPNAPLADQDIRVGEGTVYLSPKIQ